MTQINKTETILWRGTKALGTSQQTSDGVDLNGVDGFHICIVSVQSGDWEVEVKYNNQWLPFDSGTYVANEPKVLYMNDDVPPEVRLKVTQGTKGKLFASLRIRDYRYEESTTPTDALDWLGSVVVPTFQQIGKSNHNVLSTVIRESAVLTNSYVVSSVVNIERYQSFCLFAAFTTGNTGVTDEWLPNYQIEVSTSRTGDNWFYVNTQSIGTIINKSNRTVYKHNDGVMYTSPDTVYKDIITPFSDNPGWKRIRVSVKDEKTPTNAGSMVMYLTARE